MLIICREKKSYAQILYVFSFGSLWRLMCRSEFGLDRLDRIWGAIELRLLSQAHIVYHLLRIVVSHTFNVRSE